MATFSAPDGFKEHKQYVLLLKKALLLVKPDVPKKFLYFKQYAFGPKKFPLVLVDFDVGLPAAMQKAGQRPTDEGMVSLTPQDELNFEPKKGELKRIRLRKYFSTMGPGIKPVFVPEGEVDEEEGAETGTASGQAPHAPSAAPPPASPAAPASAATAPAAPPTSVPGATPAPPEPARTGGAPAGELQAKLLQRIQELQKAASHPELKAQKEQALQKAAALGADGKYADANKVLDLLAARLAAPVPAAPAQSPAPKATAPPKLSAYMNATRDWKAAKAAAADGIFALKKAILAECEPELEKEVKAKIDSLNSMLTIMDDGIVAKIQDAGNAADEERQAERNQALVKFADNLLKTLRAHPLAEVADHNPFGSFAIRAPLESVLTKISADFGA